MKVIEILKKRFSEMFGKYNCYTLPSSVSLTIYGLDGDRNGFLRYNKLFRCPGCNRVYDTPKHLEYIVCGICNMKITCAGNSLKLEQYFVGKSEFAESISEDEVGRCAGYIEGVTEEVRKYYKEKQKKLSNEERLEAWKF